MRRDDAPLLDITKAARLILEFTTGTSKQAFLNDHKTQFAILHQLSEIPWSLIAGMRDHLIHAYDAVDLEEVWKTVSQDIPDLLNKIEPLLPQEPR